ncbi:MAG: cytochrome c oxidase subunit 3 [Chloroflexota bacterium]
MSAAHSLGDAGAAAALEGRNVRTGMLLFIVTEVMLFAALFAAYFYLRGASAAWPPSPAAHRPELGLVTANTAILVTSSITLQLAHQGGRAWRRWLGATIALGAAFLAIQAYEFSGNTFSIADGVFGSTFYALTGFHGMHVAIGLLLLGVMLRRAQRGYVRPASASFAAASYYWHFVDVVWLFLFTTVYVL